MNAARLKLSREIRRRIDALELSPKKASLDAGLNETAIKDILSGKSANPKNDTLAKIARRLGCTVADLTGEKPSRRVTADTVAADIVAINELDVHIAAGNGISDDAGGLMVAQEEGAIIGTHSYPAQSFREAYGMPATHIRILAVRGNSMEPELWPGQRVMVDTADRTPSPPGVFVVWDGLGLVVKYIEVIANSDPMRVRISSAHPAFKSYERTLDEAFVNGRVVGVWKRL